MRRFFYSVLHFFVVLYLSGALPFMGISAWVFFTPVDVLRKQSHLLVIGLVLLAWILGSSAIVLVFDYYEKRRKRM